MLGKRTESQTQGTVAEPTPHPLMHTHFSVCQDMGWEHQLPLSFPQALTPLKSNIGSVPSSTIPNPQTSSPRPPVCVFLSTAVLQAVQGLRGRGVCVPAERSHHPGQDPGLQPRRSGAGVWRGGRPHEHLVATGDYTHTFRTHL